MRQIYRILRAFGFDPLQTVRSSRALSKYVSDFKAYKKARANSSFPIYIRNAWPILRDYGESAGTTGGHYFHVDLWAARKIYESKPGTHLDVGSRIDGFIAHLLCFREVEVIDIRPVKSTVRGLNFVQGDGTTLEGILSNSVASLSCLHALEHFGLGRYGDPIDPFAAKKGIEALQRVLAPGGTLYFATPIGRERLEFNAGRVFSPSTIPNEFDKLALKSFAAVDDSGIYHEGPNLTDFADARYACGMYEFMKPYEA